MVWGRAGGPIPLGVRGDGVWARAGWGETFKRFLPHTPFSNVLSLSPTMPQAAPELPSSSWLLPPPGRGGFAGDLLALLFREGTGAGRTALFPRRCQLVC